MDSRQARRLRGRQEEAEIRPAVSEPMPEAIDDVPEIVAAEEARTTRTRPSMPAKTPAVKKVKIQLMLPPNVAKKLGVVARMEGRSMSDIVVSALKPALRQWSMPVRKNDTPEQIATDESSAA